MKTKMKTILIVFGLLMMPSILMAEIDQEEIKNKAEFQKLLIQRKNLFNELTKLDQQALEAVKQGQKPTSIHAKQVSVEDKLDLLQLRLETLSIRFGYDIPELKKKDDKATNSQDPAGNDAFQRGRERTKQQLAQQTKDLMAAIDFNVFLANTRSEK
ncbi:MAG: hypothetical protein JEZ07_04745 [Phycisphaerae bacterium]|nr:hypothetical protein [Phycisphaerae bacterium]